MRRGGLTPTWDLFLNDLHGKCGTAPSLPLGLVDNALADLLVPIQCAQSVALDARGPQQRAQDRFERIT